MNGFSREETLDRAIKVLPDNKNDCKCFITLRDLAEEDRVMIMHRFGTVPVHKKFLEVGNGVSN